MEIYGSNKWTRFNRQQVIARSFPLFLFSLIKSNGIGKHKIKSMLLHLTTPYHFDARLFSTLCSHLCTLFFHRFGIVSPLMVKSISKWVSMVATTVKSTELFVSFLSRSYCKVASYLYSLKVYHIEINLKKGFLYKSDHRFTSCWWFTAYWFASQLARIILSSGQVHRPNAIKIHTRKCVISNGPTQKDEH